MDLKRPSYQHTVRWTMQGLTEPFLNIVGCCNLYRGEKLCGVYSFTGQGIIFQKLNDACKKERSMWS